MYIQGKKLPSNYHKLFFVALVFFLFFGFSGSAFAATLSISPASTQVELGGIVSETIMLSSTDQSVNAVSGTLKFDPDYLEVSSISKSSSIIGLWVKEPSYSNSTGVVNYEGVILNPGYTGQATTVLTIRFHAKKIGDTALSLASSQALANDGSGTDILTGSSGSKITIVQPTTKPTPTPAPTQTPVKPTPVPVIQAPTTTAPAPLLPAAVECRTWSSDLLQFISAAGVGFFAVLLLLLVAALLMYMIYQRSMWKPHARKELRHLDATVTKAMSLLRDDVESFVEELNQESSRRKLTLIETKFIKSMKKNLADVGEVIKKEIDGVEDTLT